MAAIDPQLSMTIYSICWQKALMPGESAETVPVEVNFRDGPTATPVASGKLETGARVAIRLRNDSEIDQLDAILRVRVSVLEDDEGTEGDLLPVEMVFEGKDCVVNELPSENEERTFRVDLAKDQWVVFSLRSKPYDAAWATKVGIELEPPETES